MHGGRVSASDAGGRIVPRPDGAGTAWRLHWDGTDLRGGKVGAGVYFVAWRRGDETLAARVTVETPAGPSPAERSLSCSWGI